jgi:hypothetical protein
VADVVVPGDVTVLAEGEAAAAAFDAALDDWLALTAAALVGIGARAAARSSPPSPSPPPTRRLATRPAAPCTSTAATAS